MESWVSILLTRREKEEFIKEIQNQDNQFTYIIPVLGAWGTRYVYIGFRRWGQNHEGKVSHFSCVQLCATP